MSQYVQYITSHMNELNSEWRRIQWGEEERNSSDEICRETEMEKSRKVAEKYLKIYREQNVEMQQ